MKKIILKFLFFMVVAALTFISMGSGEAFEAITAQEAYNMYIDGQVTLIDVRSLEECALVGNPAGEANGEPIAYIIPWNLYGGPGENGNVIYKPNPDFDALIEQTFGNDKEQKLILMCAVGIRSTYAAKRLEELNFTHVYEIDNYVKEASAYPGGRGGFQGVAYGNTGGYKGYPGRLTNNAGTSETKVALFSNEIEHEDDSVSWMDTGLPLTYKTNQDKIPKLKDTNTKESSTNNSSSHNLYPYINFSSMSYLTPSIYSSTFYPSITPMNSISGLGNSFSSSWQPWSYQPWNNQSSIYNNSSLLFPESFFINPLGLQFSPIMLYPTPSPSPKEKPKTGG